ncbi:MAG: tryptophan-rich sensory protein [Bacilli bacterium]|nr:tryptophan-rich sensory protein [Bacilli bacterium]
MKDIKKLVFYIFITIIIGSLPALFIKFSDTYNYLNKPPLAPSGIVFPIVWTILFILMGISIYRVSLKDDDVNLKIIYFSNLLINALWTPLFFGLNLYLFSFLWIIILLIVTFIMFYKFYIVDKISGYLLIPYIIWLLFAGYLNLFIYLLN